ncbi:MAG: alpha-hydroxy-acid oxidizing protein [Pseudolabrys sp.]|nr:alpha-hydroxy-acid oxidizing protein [Pseudolabrys sp.]
MPVITNIDDFREIARRKIPKAVFEYVDHGSYDQLTLAANRRELQALQFRQRVMINADDRRLATTMLGENVAMPVALAPIGMCGLTRGDGEVLAARAAEAAGIRMCLSTMSICSIEDVREAISGPFWFQLYVFRDRGFSESVIERVKAAGCTALFVTVDLPMRGQRHCDLKNGVYVPPRLTLRNAYDLLTKVGWSWSVLKAKRRGFTNIQAYIDKTTGGGMMDTARWADTNFDGSLSWNDIAWIRKNWRGKLVIKGVLDPADAKIALDNGADAIVVSNHGGRQLDGAPATISALPYIADAVGNDIEVLFDGGIRSGQDVLKALSLGARGCLIGRAFVYGLMAQGGPGVAKAIDLIKEELKVSMSLTGVKDVHDVTRDVLFNPPPGGKKGRASSGRNKSRTSRRSRR